MRAKTHKSRSVKVPNLKDLQVKETPRCFKPLHGEKGPRQSSSLAVLGFKLTEQEEDRLLKMVGFMVAAAADNEHRHVGARTAAEAMFTFTNEAISRFLRCFQPCVSHFSVRIIKLSKNNTKKKSPVQSKVVNWVNCLLGLGPNVKWVSNLGLMVTGLFLG